MPDVRPAQRRDVGDVSSALSVAFARDPVASYLFPDERRRRRCLPKFFRVQLTNGYLRRGEVFVTDDCLGAAMWIPSWADAPTLHDRLAHLSILPLVRGRFPAAHQLTELLAAHHPRRPHYYLGTLGVDPQVQGQGYATALMAPLLERCDAEGVGAYLECSTGSNVSFYARRGFVVSEKVTAPFGGPPLWLMWREPEPV